MTIYEEWERLKRDLIRNRMPKDHPLLSSEVMQYNSDCIQRLRNYPSAFIQYTVMDNKVVQLDLGFTQIASAEECLRLAMEYMTSLGDTYLNYRIREADIIRGVTSNRGFVYQTCVGDYEIQGSSVTWGAGIP